MFTAWKLFACLLLGCSGIAPVHAQQRVAIAPRESPLSNLGTRSRGVDWPTFLGPTGDGKSTERALVSWPPEGPPIVWQKEIGTGYGIGSTSKGRYFHFDRAGRVARVLCFAAETGEELWRFEYSTNYRDMLGYNNGPRSSPVIDGNRVYAYGVEGILHCLRASDGEMLWRIDTSAKYGVVQNFFGVGSTPAVAGDLLICMVGGSPPGSPGLYESGGRVDGNGSAIVAFDKFTGGEIYRVSDELASYSSPKIAVIEGRTWGFLFARGGLLGFQPASGKIEFHYPWRDRKLESVNASTPVVVGNEVFVSETYGIGSSLLAVKPGGYDIIWRDARNRRAKSLLTHWNTPIYVDGYLYGCSGRNPPDADLRCLEWKTGKVQWVEQSAGARRERSSLLYVDGHFVVLGEFGTLKLIRANPKEYDLVSEVVLQQPANDPTAPPRRLLKSPCWAAPILSHGLLYVRGDDRIVCLDVSPGRE